MGNFFSEAFGGHSHYETFEYTVEKEFDGWEIRSYPDRVAAQTQIKSVDAESGEKKNNNGFMVLAKYIGVFRAPENKKAGGGDSEGVAMTTPVVMADSSKNESEAVECKILFVFKNRNLRKIRNYYYILI